MKSPESPVWILMPVMSNRDLTMAAIADCLAQTMPVRVLVVLQDVDPPFREEIEALCDQDDRVLSWYHSPPLPSLSATWNRALMFVWQVGGTEALVVNNDVRLHAETVRFLSLARHQTEALFVTAVGRATEAETLGWSVDIRDLAVSRGGPDFSCFLIAKDCHEKYPFDEQFVPAFCEDLDYHRRLMLGGDGDKIFSINLPYLHYASQTIKTMTPEKAAKLHRSIEAGSRTYYQKKWGGPVNHERWTIPFDATTDQDGVTTPDLQRMIQGEPEPLVVGTIASVKAVDGKVYDVDPRTGQPWTIEGANSFVPPVKTV